MSFESKEFSAIFEDLRSRASQITDFEVGSVARTMYESFAYELSLLYEKMRLVYLSAYVDTAEGQQLNNVVSVLGMKRGEPDFALGVVTFTRDTGGGDVTIPVGTLVATPEAPGSPKRTYQTTEAKTLTAGARSADVKVQALINGEEQTVPQGAITVMPRPIPGIKSVSNAAATVFSGKRRETDEELRERAKNALISSGKATVVSIENALLSLSGVKDVKVREPFHFAQGGLRFTRTAGGGNLPVPKGTVVTAAVGEVEKPFETTERVELLPGALAIDVGARSTLEGKAGEIPNVTDVPDAKWRIVSDGLPSLAVKAAQPFLLREFGIIEVYVDGPDLADRGELELIQGEVDRVRPAGVLALIKSATPVELDGVFRIVLNPALKLTSEEITRYENAVRSEIDRFLEGLKMGEPLLFSKLIKTILSVDGVDNIEDFRLETVIRHDAEVGTVSYVLADKRIEIEEFERFHARFLCVAAEDKTLYIDVEFKAGGLNTDKVNAVRASLRTYINELPAGAPVAQAEVVSRIRAACGAGLQDDTVRLRAEAWCERETIVGGKVIVTFVEKPVLRDVFGYGGYLDITGAVRVTLPADITSTDMDVVTASVEEVIAGYLDSLPSEADVVFSELYDLIKKNADRRILAAELNWHDFSASLNDVEQPARTTKDKIEVSLLEKAHARYVFVTNRIAPIAISMDAVSLKMLVAVADTVIAGLKTGVKNRINNFFSEAMAGRNVVFADFLRSIEGLVPGVSYGVTGFGFTARSGDGRSQQTSLGTAKDVRVRSVEIPVIVPVTETNVTVTPFSP